MRGLLNVEQPNLSRNWYGIASVIVLFVWFLIAKGATSLTVVEQVALWLLLAVAHVLAVQAIRLRRHGWIYLLPLLTVWTIVLIGITGIFH